MDEDNSYFIGGAITGGIVFLGCWVYAIATWGWFLGLAFGWIPAAIIGAIAGFLWPLVAIAVLAIVVLLVLDKR